VAILLSRLDMRQVRVTWNGSDPTTSVDCEVNNLLRAILPRYDEAWLSEESKDDSRRLQSNRVWIVDPLDGTREFLLDIPEWCVSVALVEDGYAVAGGVLDPSTGEIFLGAEELGLKITGPQCARVPVQGKNLRMLVSRTEYSAGKWRHFEDPQFTIVPAGSIAYRLAHVAAGWAGATCTLGPRHEWDVAAGVALVRAAGGRVEMLNGQGIRFNRATTNVGRFFAFSRHCDDQMPQLFCGEIA